MIVIGEIPTRRFDMPEDAGFFKETKVVLLCKRSERKHNEGSSVIELFLKLYNGKDSLLLETDTILEWWEVPNPAQDARNWGKMRTLVQHGVMPDDAYLMVSIRSLLRKWKYSVDIAESGVQLTIERLGRPAIATEAQKLFVMGPFLFDDPRPEDEEDEEDSTQEPVHAHL
jgi:hypothetical protein